MESSMPSSSTSNVNTKWYVLRVISTKERQAKEFIETNLEQTPLKRLVRQVFLPTEKVYKIQRGKKVSQERNYYPGYLMVEIEGDQVMDDLKDIIKSAQYVLHFLGQDHPTALSKGEVAKMLGKMDEMRDDTADENMSNPYIVGETVKIIEGPFNDFNGVIEEVSLEKKRLTVVVKIFGRSTPVDLNFFQVERLS